jgi:hypothetical protein
VVAQDRWLSDRSIKQTLVHRDRFTATVIWFTPRGAVISRPRWNDGCYASVALLESEVASCLCIRLDWQRL